MRLTFLDALSSYLHGAHLTSILDVGTSQKNFPLVSCFTTHTHIPLDDCDTPGIWHRRLDMAVDG